MPPPDDWTPEEADAALPRITDIVQRVRSTAGATRQHARRAGQSSGGNGHAPAGREAVTFREAVAELAAEGIVLRDADAGLIDFPARTADGRRYWLCWVVGEAAVSWWHWPEDGFAGRRPLGERPA